jgi:hypothetical protein
MAFKTVSDLSTDNAIALGGFNRKTNKENPTQIVGYFIGSKEVDSPKSKTGKAKLHVFQTPKGNVGVWGKTDLDQKLAAATVGALTRVSFTGMQETKNNPMYKYKVEVDTDDKIEVAPPTNDSFTSGGEEEGSYTEAAYDEPSDDEENDVDEAPPARAVAPRTPARPPTQASQDRVQALLNRRK